ncbi:hypothetical protein D9M68_542040 [compost metagenome]
MLAARPGCGNTEMLDGEPALMSITICCSELCEHECFTVAPVAFSKLAMTFLNMPSSAPVQGQVMVTTSPFRSGPL